MSSAERPGHVSRTIRWSISILLAVVLPVAATAACADDDSGSSSGDGGSSASSSQDAAVETAAAVCGLLVDWSNDLTESINATSKAITDADDPDTANGVLLGGFDELIGLAQDHVDEAEGLELPDLPDDEAGRLADGLAAGAQASIETLERGRDEAEALPPIDVPAQAGALGGALNRVESAKSVVEPVIEAYDDPDLRQAFRDEPDCTHVVQPLF